MPSSRRAFLVACGTVVTAGCVARGGDRPEYQIVGGVEWKTLRGTRANTIRKIAQNRPVNGPVVDTAPTELQLRTMVYDDTVVDLSGSGSLTLTDETIGRIESEYEDPYGVIVLTLYNADPHNAVPKGNSQGYRASLSEFNRIDPGDRISATVVRTREVPVIDELLTVDKAAPQ